MQAINSHNTNKQPSCHVFLQKKCQWSIGLSPPYKWSYHLRKTFSIWKVEGYKKHNQIFRKNHFPLKSIFFLKITGNSQHQNVSTRNKSMYKNVSTRNKCQHQNMSTQNKPLHQKVTRNKCQHKKLSSMTKWDLRFWCWGLFRWKPFGADLCSGQTCFGAEVCSRWTAFGAHYYQIFSEKFIWGWKWKCPYAFCGHQPSPFHTLKVFPEVIGSLLGMFVCLH